MFCSFKITCSIENTTWCLLLLPPASNLCILLWGFLQDNCLVMILCIGKFFKWENDVSVCVLVSSVRWKIAMTSCGTCIPAPMPWSLPESTFKIESWEACSSQKIFQYIFRMFEVFSSCVVKGERALHKDLLISQLERSSNCLWTPWLGLLIPGERVLPDVLDLDYA